MEKLRNMDVSYVKGIGPKRAEMLKTELGISSAADLLLYYPDRYIDRSSTVRTTELEGDMPAVQMRGRFVSLVVHGEGVKSRLVGLFTDGFGSIEVLWFRNIKNIRKIYTTGTEYVIFGKPTFFAPTRSWSMVHPEIDTAQQAQASTGIRAVYTIPEKLRNKGITSRILRQWVLNALAAAKNIKETLPPSIIDKYQLMPISQALGVIHNPQDNHLLQLARTRFKFEELFYIQVDILKMARNRKNVSRGPVFSRVGNFFNRFYRECLPFTLTEAQMRVMREIRADVATGKQMNRLVQGDVGSGKTVVALMSMLLAIDNGYQACLMAPTEILATQHFESLRAMVAQIGINVKLLTGSTRTAERREIAQGLMDGSVQMLVGTHALIEDTVKFGNLGIAVIDEQHRFGVAQRARLWTKNILTPHVLVMTATPIPRTLAMTVYGDLDVSVIDSLPAGRKPIKTILRYQENRYDVYRSIGAQLRQGRQVYIVHPLIEENEKLNARSLEEGFDDIREVFGKYYKIAYVHGRMASAEKDRQMQMFADGDARILVATTVIEVGVNVPNATVMVIENAERFGLSQLHQLRGRVGRGSQQSYCILMSHKKLSGETRKRLELMTVTTDGFVIAEEDMKMRGPGDIEGTMQSGIPFKLNIANLARDGHIIQMARAAAQDLLDADPTLSLPENASFVRALNTSLNRKVDWSRIS